MDPVGRPQDPVFPIEIFSLIIKELAAGNVNEPDIRASMQSCSLVCKDFVPLCQSCLFREVELNYILRHRPHQGNNQKLMEMLSGSPHVSKYIRSVICKIVISGQHEASYETLPDDLCSRTLQQYFPNARSLSFGIKHLCFVIPVTCVCHRLASQALTEFGALQDLTHLTISGSEALSGSLSAFIKFPGLRSLELGHCSASIPLRQDLDTLGPEKRSHNLTSLKLYHVRNFAFPVLAYLGQLEHIECDNVSYCSYDDEWLDSKVANRVVSYRHLRMVSRLDIRALSFMCYAAEASGVRAFPALKLLRLDAEGHHIRSGTAKQVLAHVQVLEKISISLNFVHTEYAELDLTQCFQAQRRTLKDITISASLRPQVSDPEYGPATIGMICDALECVKKHNVIQRINLVLDINDIYRFMETLKRPSNAEWARLDHLLVGDGVDNFPDLRNVSIYVYSATFGFSPAKEGEKESLNHWIFTDYLREPLRGLRSSTDIDFRGRLHRIYSGGYLIAPI